MVIVLVKKEEYKEMAVAYTRGTKQYYTLNIITNEIEGMNVCLSHTYDHQPTEEDKTQLYNDYLAVLKANKIKDIIAYDTSSAVNQFYLAGNPAWLSKADRVGLSNSIAIEKAASFATTTLYLNGMAITIPVDSAIQMLSALELYALACYRQTEEHKIAVSQLTTIQEVIAYDYTQGYPEKPNFEL